MNVMLKPAQELELVRDYRAPRERVFAAWTDPDKAARWWVPQDCTLVSCKMDVRPGGGWHRRMQVPSGGVIAKWGEYREIVSPERLVFTYNTEHADGTVDAETLVTVTFEVELVGAGKGWADKPRLGVHAVASISPQDFGLPSLFGKAIEIVVDTEFERAP